MSRRSTPQSIIDERDFPVRIRVAQPNRGFGPQLDRIHAWLRAEIGAAEHGLHSSGTIGADAIAVYFRDLTGARRFLAAFPDLELADGTQSLTYSTPAHYLALTTEDILGVCNLYSQTKGPAAIIAIARAMTESVGNMPPLPGIFPDQFAPVVRNIDQSRELAMLRWGMPSPAFALKNRKTDSGITNIRNTSSPHWRRWLGPQHRCVVPFTAFCEYDTRPGKDREPVWFALGEDRPLAFFAGVWTRWTSVRKLKEGETTNDLFGFLTTDANAIVSPMHPKAMPVILTSADEVERWLTAPESEALELQRPLPDGLLHIVARGALSDGAAEG